MQEILTKCQTTDHTEIELSVLAALLHSFYTGIENIFKRVAVELDGGLVHGDSWHRELLLQTTSPIPPSTRPAANSQKI